MSYRPFLPALAISGCLVLGACGGEDTSSEAASEAQTTPAQAVQEIGAVRAALDKALASVKRGDRAAADEALSEGYVDHFEKVEGPLGKVDHHLNEELEEAISTELRDKVKGGASRAEVQRLVAGIKDDLAAAERKLR